jgi:signal peptidase I
MPSYQDLALEIAAQTPILRLRIKGTSMAPLFRDGEAVTIQSVPYELLRQGDIIAFRLRGETITHRIVALEPHHARTLGDNLRALDPPVPPEAILGRVMTLERNGRPIHLTQGAWPFLHRTLARFGSLMVTPQPRVVSRFFQASFWLVRHLLRIFLFI